MSRHADVPVDIDGGTIEYLPSSTSVTPDKPPPRGFGRRGAPDDGLFMLGKLDRERSPRVTLEDGRTGRVESWEDEALRLRGVVAELEAMRATWAASIAADIMDKGA